MSERNSVYVFKGPTIDDFRDAMVSVVNDLGGTVDWDTHPKPFLAKLWTSHNANVHAAYIRANDYNIALGIGTKLRIPWINVRIQEGSLWDYSLFQTHQHLHTFSTLPEFWNSDPQWIATQRGDAQELERVWGVDQTTVENYLKPWEDSRGKAYPTDQFGYGDIWQMTDFLRALGAHDPNFDQPHCVAREMRF